jgi:hypothetical protein
VSIFYVLSFFRFEAFLVKYFGVKVWLCDLPIFGTPTTFLVLNNLPHGYGF